MAQSASIGSAPGAIEAVLREDLASADRVLANATPILRHLLQSPDRSIYSDQVMASVRGLLADIANQLVAALAEAAGHEDVQAWTLRASGELASVLGESTPLLGHLHALAIEAQLAERLRMSGSVDTALPPLVAKALADSNASVLNAATDLLEAQSRFGQLHRRMKLPLADLPGDLCHIALMTMRTYVGGEAGADGYALIAERTLRNRIDEGAGRLGLLGRLLDGLGDSVASALSITEAGVSLFASALARGSGIPREGAILAMTDAQHSRLALALRACGLPASAIAVQFAALHPDASLPIGLDDLRPVTAGAILSAQTNHAVAY